MTSVAALRERLQPWIGALRVVGFLASVALLVATGVTAARHVHRDDLAWWALAGGVVAATAWWLALATLWSIVATGRRSRAAATTWCRTQVLRYLPGGFWAPASRFAVVDGTALDRLSIVVAENAIGLCAALGLGGLMLALAGDWWWAGLGVALAVPAGVARIAPRRLAPDRARGGMLAATAGFAAYLACAVLVQAGVSGSHALVATAGAAGIAWGAGLVVVISPGGLGVRELVFIELMHGRLARGDLAAGALLARLATIAAELAVFVWLGRGRPAGIEKRPARAGIGREWSKT